jgi:hypothetical protein
VVYNACLCGVAQYVDERDEEDDFNYHQDIPVLEPKDYEHRDPILIEEFLKIHDEIEDKSLHERLRDDLVEHLWALHSAALCIFLLMAYFLWYQQWDYLCIVLICTNNETYVFLIDGCEILLLRSDACVA